MQSSFAWLRLKLRNCWLVFSAVSSLLQITAVCNFFTYIRYIHQGLVKQQDGKKRASGLLWWLDISVIKLPASLCVCSRTDVLGGDAAPQGNVPRQAWLLQRPAVTGAVLHSQQSLSWSPAPPWLLPLPLILCECFLCEREKLFSIITKKDWRLWFWCRWSLLIWTSLGSETCNTLVCQKTDLFLKKITLQTVWSSVTCDLWRDACGFWSLKARKISKIGVRNMRISDKSHISRVKLNRRIKSLF